MANTKISGLTAGNPAVGTDIIPIDRAGANFSVTAASVAALAQATSPQTIASASGTGLAANVSTTALVASIAVTGLYAVDWEVECQTAATSGATAVLGLQWKMSGATTSQNQSTTALNAVNSTGQNGLRKVVFLTAGDPFQYFINFTVGTGGAPTYRYSIVLTKIA